MWKVPVQYKYSVIVKQLLAEIIVCFAENARTNCLPFFHIFMFFDFFTAVLSSLICNFMGTFWNNCLLV